MAASYCSTQPGQRQFGQQQALATYTPGVLVVGQLNPRPPGIKCSYKKIAQYSNAALRGQFTYGN